MSSGTLKISFRRRKLRRSPGGGVSRLDAVGGLECGRDKSSICWQPRCWVSSRRMCDVRGYGDGEARDGDPRRAAATGGCARSDAAEIRPGWNRGEGLSIRPGAGLALNGLAVNGAQARSGWRGLGLSMLSMLSMLALGIPAGKQSECAGAEVRCCLPKIDICGG